MLTESNKKEYEHCIQTFQHLYKHCLDRGHITDDHFEIFGIPKNVDIMGNQTRRVWTITQENRQRATCLSHIYQRDLRQERIDCANVEATRKRWKINQSLLIRLNPTRRSKKNQKTNYRNNLISPYALFNTCFYSLERES